MKGLFYAIGLGFLLDSIIKQLKLPSGVILFLVNLFPIFGVIILGWNPYDIIFIYWLESIVIGVTNTLKIYYTKAIPEGVIGDLSKIIHINDQQVAATNKDTAIGFLKNYAFITVAHSILVFGSFWFYSSFWLEKNFWGPIVFFMFLCFSHGFSYCTNYLKGKEYLTKTAKSYVAEPYKRVIVMQSTILIGAAVTAIDFIPNSLIIVFIFLKIITDLKHHNYEHEELRINVSFSGWKLNGVPINQKQQEQ